MKQLLALLALVLVLGIVSVLYRSALERPYAGTNRQFAACLVDAQMCPDGSAIGRVAPACAFAACPFPNVELPGPNIAFAVPSGFAQAPNTTQPDSVLIAVYTSSPITGSNARIEIRHYGIPEGNDANAVAIETANASGASVRSMLDFEPILVEGVTFETVEIPDDTETNTTRVAHYLLRDTDVLRFDSIDSTLSTTSATEPKGKSAVQALLTTLAQR